MAGLLSRLAKGLAVGVESYATSALEEKRQARLDKIRSEGIKATKAFQTQERIAGQEFKSGEAQLSREAAVESQTQQETARSDLQTQKEDSMLEIAKAKGVNEKDIKNPQYTEDLEGTKTLMSYTIGQQSFSRNEKTDRFEVEGTGKNAERTTADNAQSMLDSEKDPDRKLAMAQAVINSKAAHPQLKADMQKFLDSKQEAPQAAKAEPEALPPKATFSPTMAKEDFTAEMRDQMTAEDWKTRKKHLAGQSEDAKATTKTEKAEAKQVAETFLELEYPSLSKKEKRKWVLANSRNFGIKIRKKLLAETR